MTPTRERHPKTFGSRLASLALITLGCSPATTLSPNSLPDGAVLVVAPTEYRAWWARTETCSGITGDFDRVAWYTVPGVGTMETDIGEKVGIWGSQGGQSTITIAGDYLEHELVVRHEMLHELLGREGHPDEYFVARCGLTWESWQLASGE
jgi:hypothetical protein